MDHIQRESTMAFKAPKGWETESDTLFIHKSGVRIARMTYKGKDGWFLVPVDIKAPVVEFEPTPEGRDKAFEAFDKGVVEWKARRKPAKAKAKAKAGKAEKETKAAAEDDEEKEGDEEEEEEKPEPADSEDAG